MVFCLICVVQMLYWKKRATELLHAQRQFKALGELLKVRHRGPIPPTTRAHHIERERGPIVP